MTRIRGYYSAAGSAKVQIRELKLMVRLLTDGSVVVSACKKQLANRNAQIAVLENAFGNFNEYLKSKTRSHGVLQLKLDSACAAVSRREDIITDFANMVRTGHSALVRAQFASYYDRLKIVIAEVHRQGECLCGFRMRVSENSRSQHIDGTDIEKERGGRTTSHGADGDDVEVVPSQAGPS